MPREQRRDGIYYIGDHKLPSVTTILGAAIAKPFLIDWAAKMAAKAGKENPDWPVEKIASAHKAVRDAGGVRGTAVHDLVEAWARAVTGGTTFSDEPMLDPQYRGYEKAFRRFVRRYKPEPIHTECVVFNLTHQYAGRLDLIAKVGGEVGILDFKTSKYVNDDHKLQLAAYKNAEFIEVSQGETVPMVPVDFMSVVLLGEDGTPQVKDVDEPFEVFLASRTIWSWLKTQ